LIKKLDAFSRDLILVKGIKSHPVVGDHNCIVQNCSQSLNIINENNNIQKTGRGRRSQSLETHESNKRRKNETNGAIETITPNYKGRLFFQNQNDILKQLPKINKRNFPKRNIIITGSPKPESVIFLLQNVFSIREPLNDFKKSYETDKFMITIACDLEKANFDFKSFQTKCNDIRKNLCAIITIENLNPSPETLMNSMNILEKIFSSHELEELLYVLFTSNKDMDEKYIKESFLKFDSVFRILGISNEINKKNYVNKRVFALNNEICTYLIKKLDSFSRDLILVKGIKSHPVVGDHNCIVQNCSQSLNIINEMESKIIFLIGPIGYGKSTTGCTLLRKRNAFTSGSDIQRVTGVLRSQVGTNGMLVIDSPGVGDASDDTVFQEQFLKNKNYLLNI
jgi:flagellar biosynthesis GTPase FlhF